MRPSNALILIKNALKDKEYAMFKKGKLGVMISRLLFGRAATEGLETFSIKPFEISLIMIFKKTTTSSNFCTTEAEKCPSDHTPLPEAEFIDLH